MIANLDPSGAKNRLMSHQTAELTASRKDASLLLDNSRCHHLILRLPRQHFHPTSLCSQYMYSDDRLYH